MTFCVFLVNFVVVPAFKIKSNISYFPARPNVDFSPTYGQIIFPSGSNMSQLTININPSDDVFQSDSNKMFFVFLLNTENCETCQFGLKRKANVYMWFVKPSLISMSTGGGPIVYLNSSLNRLCATNRDKHLLKLDVQFDLVDGDKLGDEIMQNVVQQTYLLANSTQLFLSSGHTECIFVMASNE